MLANQANAIFPVGAASTFNHIGHIKGWFAKAAPAPDSVTVHDQLALHFGHISQMLEVLKDAGKTYSSRQQIGLAHQLVSYIQQRFNDGREGTEVAINDLDRVALLASLCEQIVGAVGLAHMLDLNIEGALQQVALSNASKFDAEGNPIYNEREKVVAGPNYYPARLAAFT